MTETDSTAAEILARTLARSPYERAVVQATIDAEMRRVFLAPVEGVVSPWATTWFLYRPRGCGRGTRASQEDV